MRIISGRLRGKRLLAPTNLPVRPTTDIAKEALFNILANEFDFDELSVVDLFAGTGNISYEFASRGALSVRCVDIDRSCTKYISKTVSDLKMDQIRVINADVFKFLSMSQAPADVVFADPPYDLEPAKYELLLRLVFENGILSEDGIMVVEHSKAVDLSYNEYYRNTRTYGTVNFSFFESVYSNEQEV